MADALAACLPRLEALEAVTAATTPTAATAGAVSGGGGGVTTAGHALPVPTSPDPSPPTAVLDFLTDLLLTGRTTCPRGTALRLVAHALRPPPHSALADTRHAWRARSLTRAPAPVALLGAGAGVRGGAEQAWAGVAEGCAGLWEARRVLPRDMHQAWVEVAGGDPLAPREDRWVAVV